MIDDLIQLGKLISLGLALMLPLANPLTSMTLLLSLGQQIPYKERERQVTQAAFYVVGIMLVTYYAGAWIMHTFGISIPGLRIAGGLIVVSIGFSMLFPKADSSTLEAGVAADAQHQRQTPNIAFVPLALPGTAGPGTIAMIISGAASVDTAITPDYASWVIAVTPVIVFALLGVFFWICLRSAGRIVAVIGQSGVEAISRVMGFLLVCMGVQFVINGVLEIVSQHAGG
ncbi:MarC family NAAT transporter [Achromobacter sp. UMC46]|uniref:MarC family NAAT transporter n=1 Tax=Achromobacter sp. UMC46 TaxID=1862319 RepID=UPI0027148513|nr:MarC family NAAT transporter [Achromobacter sp. UMC46]MBB1595872.1 stress protection protein MarC [Achromobacter sp. UMC46]